MEASDQSRWPPAYRAVFCGCAVLFAAFYGWLLWTGNPPLDWRTASTDANGYYDLLARGFAAGHLHLSVDPPPELLALPDPWDPARNLNYAARDLVLYHGRYYLYHGPAPALFLFTPWRMISHRDLPQPFATLLFCYFGYLFAAATFMRLGGFLAARPPLWLFVLLLIALGTCQCAPFVLERGSVFEVAISSGYFSISAAFWFLTLALTGSGRRIPWAACAGFFFGAAVGCRPNLIFAGFAGAIALVWVDRQKRALCIRELAAFMVPFAACGVAIAAYNYGRFHNPFEFGMRYEMAAANYLRPTPEAKNLTPGLYYLLASPPLFDPVFPFIRFALRLPFTLPGRYFLEPIAGAFAIWPLAILGLTVPWLRRTHAAARAILGAMIFAALAGVLFIASLGLVSHRFEMDYLPELVFAGCFVLVAARLPRWATAIAVGMLVYGIFANVAIGIEGPYGNFVQQYPRSYVGLARCFSPVERFRPMLDPVVAAEADFEFPSHFAGSMPLLSAGRFGARYALSAEIIGEDRLRLTSFSTIGSSVSTAEVPLLKDAPNHLRFDYADHTIEIRWNGQLVARHSISALVTAPAQITLGEDRTEINTWPAHFPGKVRVTQCVVRGS